jgi:hypothetical protein
LAVVGGYVACLIAVRPASPFEWDEVLFLRALAHYDVAGHSPHPPGYPVFVAAGKVAQLLVGDPIVALQAVSILVAAAMLVGMWSLAGRLRAPERARWLALAAAVAVPAFSFHANVGLSDMAGAAAGLLACGAAVRARQTPGALPLAAVAAGLTLGVRPQLVSLLLPTFIWAFVAVVRQRRLGELSAAAVAGFLTVAACWLPAALLTGWRAFLATNRDMARYVSSVEGGFHLPGAPLGEVAHAWFVLPFGTPALAAIFWLAVALGARRWWRGGHHSLVGVAGASAASYLAVSLFSANYTTAVRYVVPALPFLVLLAAGVTESPVPSTRVIAVAGGAAWAVAALAWAAPVYLLRRQPAPVWEMLTFIKEHYRPEKSFVVFDPELAPHTEYVLRDAGFPVLREAGSVVYDASMRPGSTVLLLTPQPVPGGRVAKFAEWSSDRMRRLTRDRYLTCAVVEAAGPGQVAFSPAFQVFGREWDLWQTGLVRLLPPGEPRAVRITAGRDPVRVGRTGFARFDIPSHSTAIVPLFPGLAGEVRVEAPSDVETRMPPLAQAPLDSVSLGPSAPPFALVPLVARLDGLGSSRWRSDLLLANPTVATRVARVWFLASQRDNTRAALREVTLAPHEVRVMRDVLGAFDGSSAQASGALLVAATRDGAVCGDAECGLVAAARTYNASAPDNVGVGQEWLPGLPPSGALEAGCQASFGPVRNSERTRSSVGLVSWSTAPTDVVVTVVPTDGQEPSRRTVTLPPFGHSHTPLGVEVRECRVDVGVSPGAGRALVLAYLSSVEAATGVPTHRLPDLATPCPVFAGLPPVPRAETR